MQNKSKNNIVLLFRKPSERFFSIEEVFGNLIPFLEGEVDLSIVYLPYSNSGFWNKIKNILFVRRIKCDLLHVTGEIYYSLALFHGKLLVTYHDIGEIFTGSRLRRYIIRLVWYQSSSRKANAISFVSSKSKKEFHEHIGDKSKIAKVIPNPVSSDYEHTPSEIHEPFRVLHIGTKSNKNLRRLIESIKGLSLELKIIGHLNQDYQELLSECNINYINQSNLSSDDIKKAYINTDLVSFVSTYEGFGMPIIEAQAIGRPVITSNFEPFIEVAGQGAYFVDPYDTQSIRNGLIELSKNDDLRKRLIQEGSDNVKRFSPGYIASKYLELYDQIINGQTK